MNTFDAHKRTVKEVFTYIYEIPFYQRGYSWKSDQIRQFWDDLMMVKEEGHSEYFMGSIVINEENKDLLQVIDGQQRLTTITIFLSAIRDLLIINNNKESAFNIHQNYIAERNIWGGKDKFRLTLSEINLEFFQEFIQLPIDNDSRKGQDDFSKISNNRRRASNDLIWNAHLEIKTYVENYLIDNDNDLNSILELVELLTKSFLIISISVNSDTDAYIIFETLNDRGMDLSTADLLKNHLFSKVNKTEVSTVQRSWTELTNTLNQDNITTFLRHYWLAKYERVTDKKLYEKIKRYLQKRNVSVRNFVEELNASADIYVNIKNPTLSYWSDNELVKSLQNINTLNYKTAYSLILIGKLKLSNSNLKTIADACEKFVFKFTTICGYSPSEVEKIFGNVTKVLRDNGG
ncbi:DUF262 domain-containing protein [Gracilibacillus sp. JCM 18860]|uniref:GmrSD restriction endonuclease domain-containing protein n=1 Tax=Gracilibacillus sp. JCM 18860 TaxID=1306159 RepID=UPI0006D1B49F